MVGLGFGKVLVIVFSSVCCCGVSFLIWVFCVVWLVRYYVVVVLKWVMLFSWIVCGVVWVSCGRV